MNTRVVQRWHVAQATCKPREYAVRIVVRPWSETSVGARVRPDGETTCVEVVLTPALRRAELERLDALGYANAREAAAAHIPGDFGSPSSTPAPVAAIAATRRSIHGEPAAPSTREDQAHVTIGTMGAALSRLGVALSDGVITDHEAAGVAADARALMRDLERLIGKLGEDGGAR